MSKTSELHDRTGLRGSYFFLSYARPSVSERVQGDPDRDFAAFYYDLCAALTRFAPLDRLHSLGAVSGEWNTADGANWPYRAIQYRHNATTSL